MSSISVAAFAVAKRERNVQCKVKIHVPRFLVLYVHLGEPPRICVINANVRCQDIVFNIEML